MICFIFFGESTPYIFLCYYTLFCHLKAEVRKVYENVFFSPQLLGCVLRGIVSLYAESQQSLVLHQQDIVSSGCSTL